MKKGSKCSDETRRKMSESRQGEKNPCFGKFGEEHPAYGKPKSEEAKELMRLSKIGKKNPNYKPKLILKCQICNEEFKVNPSKKNRKCCSWKCYKKYKIGKNCGENNPMYNKPSWNKGLTKENNDSLKIVSEKNSGENNRMYGKSGELNPFYNRHHTNETKQKMSENHADFSLNNHPNWKDGKSFDPYCEKFNERKKEEVREQYGRKCYLCDKDEKDNITKNDKIRKLSVHHVDNDKQQGCDGKKWKLIPLCLKCHNSKKMKNIIY